MKTLSCKVSFTTPAFLGDAAQSGRWRTPPFKALLRQWWRVAWAEANGYSKDVDAMRDAEGELFGVAADGTGRRSRVRLRLDRWDEGAMTRDQWTPGAKVNHPEVRFPIDTSLYMGYGPVVLPKGQREATLKRNAAIQPGETAEVRLAFPEIDSPLLERALTLMDAYGTLGGRSRNGWGSFLLNPTPTSGEGGAPLRPWRDCLDRDWPHAIGLGDDGVPLIWQTEPHDDWQSLMKTLAIIKIGLRTQFVFPDIKPPHTGIEPRHWLSYPVTKHTTRAWPRDARLPNSLRFKVRTDETGKPHGVIFHVPCLPPQKFKPDLTNVQRVWEQVHAYLNAQSDLTRIEK